MTLFFRYDWTGGVSVVEIRGDTLVDVKLTIDDEGVFDPPADCEDAYGPVVSHVLPVVIAQARSHSDRETIMSVLADGGMNEGIFSVTLVHMTGLLGQIYASKHSSWVEEAHLRSILNDQSAIQWYYMLA